jgi:hypothetical protein
MVNIDRNTQANNDNRLQGYAVAGSVGVGLGITSASIDSLTEMGLEKKLQSLDLAKIQALEPAEASMDKNLSELKLNILEKLAFFNRAYTTEQVFETAKEGNKLRLNDAHILKVLEALKNKTPFAQQALMSSLVYIGILGLGYGVYDVFFRPKTK